ncbi:MAG: hypothetical protein CMB39_03910 [Euryarchaeota archaeon]|nr:hypothetical protein [Euryarchaeota archaeon]
MLHLVRREGSHVDGGIEVAETQIGHAGGDDAKFPCRICSDDRVDFKKSSVVMPLGLGIVHHDLLDNYAWI